MWANRPKRFRESRRIIDEVVSSILSSRSHPTRTVIHAKTELIAITGETRSDNNNNKSQRCERRTSTNMRQRAFCVRVREIHFERKRLIFLSLFIICYYYSVKFIDTSSRDSFSLAEIKTFFHFISWSSLICICRSFVSTIIILMISTFSITLVSLVSLTLLVKLWNTRSTQVCAWLFNGHRTNK